MSEKLTNGLKSLFDEREEWYFTILVAVAFICLGLGAATFSEAAAFTTALYVTLLAKGALGRGGDK
jgi:lipoprotein signal peptidase